MVLDPVPSEISRRFCRHISQEVCPSNVKFPQALKVPEFAPRQFIAGQDARTLARDILAMSQEEFSAAFKGSPMKRAKLRGLKRNAAVVLGNMGTTEDLEVLIRALNDPEPLPSTGSGQAVREHAACALTHLAAC
jgi:epoxyqueuosine reductase